MSRRKTESIEGTLAVSSPPLASPRSFRAHRSRTRAPVTPGPRPSVAKSTATSVALGVGLTTYTASLDPGWGLIHTCTAKPLAPRGAAGELLARGPKCGPSP